MLLPAAPRKVTCQSCGWSKIIPQQGDVFFSPNQCERCGSEKLSGSSAVILDRLNLAPLFQTKRKK